MNSVMRMLCTCIKDRKVCIGNTLSSLLIDSSEENAAIRLMQKQHLIVNAILLFSNHALFIKRNMREQVKKIKKNLTWEDKMMR